MPPRRRPAERRATALEAYRRKRSFHATPEPGATRCSTATVSSPCRSAGKSLVTPGASYLALREVESAPDVHLDAFATTGNRENQMKIVGIPISHPDQFDFPSDGIAKMEVVRYYERVADYTLPHLVHRSLALLRAPAGLSGEMFFQKSFSGHLPDQV